MKALVWSGLRLSPATPYTCPRAAFCITLSPDSCTSLACQFLPSAFKAGAEPDLGGDLKLVRAVVLAASALGEVVPNWLLRALNARGIAITAVRPITHPRKISMIWRI